LDWNKYEVRIYKGVERILRELASRDLHATFFCLGWIAEKHPDVIRWIHEQGHHIGCHSYQHGLVFHFDRNSFKRDAEKSKRLIEDVIGEAINAFRAPGFSITEQNTWALEVLCEIGFEYDCSLFPATHDYGGFTAFGNAEPAVLKLANGVELKEFPMSVRRFFGTSVVFSGGGYFRLLPYWLIKYWASKTHYLMTYFHTRDFDSEQPIIGSLPLKRRFKSYVGLSTAFAKFQKLLNDFRFISVEDADSLIDWNEVRVIKL
jgi:polysaccharide deacetylase family protein (PEP-CTERM system associated)